MQLVSIELFFLPMTTKQQFLIEHNGLSPANLQATEEMLTRFRAERASVFKENDWSIEKIRRPFILWLTSLPSEERAGMVVGNDGGRVGLGKGVKAKFASATFASYPKKKGAAAWGICLPKNTPIPAKSRF